MCVCVCRRCLYLTGMESWMLHGRCKHCWCVCVCVIQVHMTTTLSLVRITSGRIGCEYCRPRSTQRHEALFIHQMLLEWMSPHCLFPYCNFHTNDSSSNTLTHTARSHHIMYNLKCNRFLDFLWGTPYSFYRYSSTICMQQQCSIHISFFLLFYRTRFMSQF